MLGNNYAPEFFDGLPNKVANPLKRICEETLEDLEGFKNILQEFGVNVIQPDMDPNERFLDDPQRYPRGPLQPRDNQLILGNACYSNKMDHPSIHKKLLEYSEIKPFKLKKPFIPSQSFYKSIAGEDFPSWEDFKSNQSDKDFFVDFVWQELIDYSHLQCCSSACCFMIGKKLFIGVGDSDNDITLSKEELPDEYKKFEVICTPVDGHSDGNYHPIKPGAILSLHDVQNYNETFPGWDICYLPDQSWSKVSQFLQLKSKNQGKWWLVGEEDNDEFTHFVETWLTDWVGYVEETVFDVNVLVLDEHHVCVSNPHNEQVNTFLKKHNMEPVYVPWRHRYFWDGGLHCITLDLVREGTQQDYFK